MISDCGRYVLFDRFAEFQIAFTSVVGVLMSNRHLWFLVGIAAVGCCALRAPAAIIYSDNFDTDTSASWTVNVAPAANGSLQQATFGYDYSAVAVPAPPGHAVNDTFGLRLRANIPGGAAAPVTTRPAGVLSGLSVSPTGQNFGANYGMTFWAWSNFNGSANASGLADNGNSEGGTNNVMMAIGTSGTVPLVVGNTALAVDGQMDGIGFATSGDGGITNDYRVYPKSGTIAPTSSLTANSYANTNVFYQTLFPSKSAPSGQQAIATAEYGGDAFPTQGGLTQAGAFGFAWHKVQIITNNNIVTWDVDGTRVATYDASALTMGGNNIALGQSDVNTSTTRHPLMLFTLFDDLEVFEVPEPASGTLAAACIAVAGLLTRRRRGA